MNQTLSKERFSFSDLSVKNDLFGYGVYSYFNSSSYEPIEADSPEAAEEECQKLALLYDVELEDVQQQGRNWFDCLFRGK